MHASCRCKNVVFVCLFVTLRGQCAVPSREVYFEQVLCRCLWVGFDAVLCVSSEGISISDGLDSSHFCC